MPQPPQQNCGNCRFLDDNYKDETPRCHRYPPQVSHYENLIGKVFWDFPEVHKGDWCGEWQPNE